MLDILLKILDKGVCITSISSSGQAQFNGGFLSNLAGNLVDSAVDRITGNDRLGDFAGAAVRTFL